MTEWRFGCWFANPVDHGKCGNQEAQSSQKKNGKNTQQGLGQRDITPDQSHAQRKASVSNPVSDRHVFIPIGRVSIFRIARWLFCISKK
jgi:hypothetical protein